MLLYGALKLVQRAAGTLLGVPDQLPFSLPVATAWSLAVHLTMMATGLALWRGYRWARWAALATWLLVVAQAGAGVRSRGIADLDPVVAAVGVVVLALFGWVVGSLWRRNPPVAG